MHQTHIRELYVNQLEQDLHTNMLEVIGESTFLEFTKPERRQRCATC